MASFSLSGLINIAGRAVIKITLRLRYFRSGKAFSNDSLYLVILGYGRHRVTRSVGASPGL